MQYGLFVFEFDEVNAGWLDIEIVLDENNPYNNGYLKSQLNNKIFEIDENRFYFGFPSGNHTFDYIVDNNIIESINFNIIEHQINYYEYTLPFDLIEGDINFDEMVSILDIIILINAILGEELTSMEFLAADLNQDEVLNILDVIELVNIILNN